MNPLRVTRVARRVRLVFRRRRPARDGAARVRGERRRARSRGHLMVALVAQVAILMVLTTAGIEEWRQILRRDAEAEMMFRAQEIVRAILRFQQSHGRPPNKLEELIEAGPKGEYFLRRLYDDPLVSDGEWGLLYAGPGGALVDPNASESALRESRPGELDTRRAPVSGLSGAFDTNQAPAIGGLPIAGVKSLSKDKPFREYNGVSDYSQWLFSIFDLQNLQVPGQGGGAGAAGRPNPRRGGVGAPGQSGGIGNRGGGRPGANAGGRGRGN